MTDGETGRVKVWPMIGWCLLCTAVIFVLIANAGDCKPGGIVYCYGDDRDYWWHPTKFIGALIFALLLPLPHILLSLFFKGRRSLYSVASIAKRWHRAFGVIVGILAVVGLLAGRMTAGA